MALDMEQSQRRDIDTSLNNRLSLDIDEENVTLSPYVLNITKYGKGNNWINGEGLVMKNNVSEEDSIKFTIPKIPSFSQKDITGINVEFDYEINNQFVNNPILSNVSFSRQDVTKYKLVEMELNDVGHIDITCSLFGFNDDDVYYAIVDEGFDIDFNFYGNKSNASIKISNIKVSLEFEDRLSDEIDTVVNRLNPQIDFWRDGDKLFLQIGDGSGKGRVDKTNIDTYTKEEIDNKLATKVDSEVGKMLSSNDYTLTEKVKLAGVEQNANNYSHPSYHSTSMIREESSLSNLNTEENASQHEVNIAIDRQMFSGDYDDLINKPVIPENVSDLTNDLDFVESGDMTTALANKQDVLLSGTNIKTINNQSVLGAGNITIQGGGGGSGRIFDLDQTSHSGNTAFTEDDDYNNQGFSLGDGILIYNGANSTFYLDKNGSRDLDNGNELVTMNDIPSLTNYVQKSATVGLLKNDGTVYQNEVYIDLISSDYYVEKDTSVTLTCTVKDINNVPISGYPLTLYMNNTVQGTGTTDSTGVATWTITFGQDGAKDFWIEYVRNVHCVVFVQNKMQLLNGANLNNVINYGYYYQGANANTTNMSNLPANNHIAFCMLVEDMGGNARKQTLTFQQNDMATYIRIKKWDNTWTAWKKVTLS